MTSADTNVLIGQYQLSAKRPIPIIGACLVTSGHEILSALLIYI